MEYYIANRNIKEYLSDKEIIPICPEIYGGLPTPRFPSEIMGDKVINDQGEDVTSKFSDTFIWTTTTVRNMVTDLITEKENNFKEESFYEK